MKRREFLSLGAAAAGLAAAQQTPFEESVTASATEDATPRIGVVPSDFDGSEDHDGTVVEGLADPRPVDADLTGEQIDAMVRKAIELGDSREGGLKTIIEPEDWVVIKTNIASCHGLGPDTDDGGAHNPYIPGSVTDLRVVRSLLSYMTEGNFGLRFSIVEGSGEWLPAERSNSPVDGWTSDWGGAFGGLSYKGLVAEFSRRYPGLEFELVDLNFDDTIPMPVQGGVSASKNPDGVYHVPRTIQQCDKLISVAPLKTDATTSVSLSVGNYFGIAPGSKYGFPKKGLLKLGEPYEVLLDLFSFHPAEFAILGGSWGIEGDGPDAPGGTSIHHNLIIAGGNAVAVDAVAASVMGFDPTRIECLDLAELNGYGILDPDSIWVRGREVAQAVHPFKKPATRDQS